MKLPLRDFSYLLITSDASVQTQSGSSFPCNMSPQAESSVPAETSIKVYFTGCTSTGTSQWQDYLLIQYSAIKLKTLSNPFLKDCYDLLMKKCPLFSSSLDFTTHVQIIFPVLQDISET